DAVALAQLRGGGGAQFRYAGGRRVARAVLAQCARHRLLDGFGRVEERLAALELVNGGALRAQLHHLVADLDDVGEADTFEPPREAEEGSGRGHVARRTSRSFGEQGRIIAPPSAKRPIHHGEIDSYLGVAREVVHLRDAE